MPGLTSWIDRKFYPGYEQNWDDRLFRQAILEALAPEFSVLDLGAGAGIVSEMNFKDHAAHVCGVDLDERVRANPFLDEGKVASAEAIPYPDATFDLVFADNVLEHLADPSTTFREVARVLKPGGYFLAKTPNKWHYMPTIARITPTSFHKFVNRCRGRQADDTFPTLYRANTRSDIERLAGDAGGLVVEDIKTVEGRPEYLRMFAATYVFGIIYERIVNSSSAFASFRVLLVVKLRKTGDPS